MLTMIRTIHSDDGSTEVQWGRGEDSEAISGYIYLTPEGKAIFPHGDGFVIHMDGKDTRVVAEEDGRVVWHVQEDSSTQVGYPDLPNIVRAALEGDSNDAEHDALALCAEALGIHYNPEG